MRQRDFITVVGGSGGVADHGVRSGQAMPVVGFLYPASPERFADRLRGFRQDLKEIGYVEGENE